MGRLRLEELSMENSNRTPHAHHPLACGNARRGGRRTLVAVSGPQGPSPVYVPMRTISTIAGACEQGLPHDPVAVEAGVPTPAGENALQTTAGVGVVRVLGGNW